MLLNVIVFPASFTNFNLWLEQPQMSFDTHPTKGTCDYEEIKAHTEKVVAKVAACERK